MKKFTIVILLSVIFLVSCAIQQTAIIATKVGFTKELDEPSVRGQLKRISPEESKVHYRFCISPDGQYLVYSGRQIKSDDPYLHLWKVPNQNAASPIKITSGGASNYLSPSFTSDGKYIVYESGGKLWKVRSDGAGGKMRIPGSGTGYDFAPHISAEDKLVFCSVQSKNYAQTYYIWTSNLDGGELTQIREGDYPSWSPDASKIVFGYKGDIWTIKSGGTELINLTNTSDVDELLPSFAADGKGIVYTSNESKEGKSTMDWNVWTMKTNGSNKVQITELDSWDSWPIWSDDGIYFLSGRAQKRNERVQRIWKLEMQ